MLTHALQAAADVPAAVWLAISAASLGLSVAGVAAVPWLVCRMPVDWFAREAQPFAERARAAPVSTLLRNALGGVLVALGIALLFLPGQGLLTIVLGVVLTDLPVRDRGLRWVASRPALAARLQAWRHRAEVPPFAGL